MNKTNVEEDILLLIKTLNKLLMNDFDKRLNEYELTCQQGRIIFFIYRKANLGKEVVHQNDIEKKLALSKSTVSGLMKRLEKKGLIEKEVNPPYYSWKATEKAMSMVNHFHQNRMKTIEKLTTGFNEEEKESLVKNINKLIDNMKKEE